MKSNKKEAVKRIRKPNSRDNNLPVVIGLSIGIVVLLVVLACVYIFVIKDKRVEKNQEIETGSSEQVSSEVPEKSIPSVNIPDTEISETENEQETLQIDNTETMKTKNTETESTDQEVNKRLNEMSMEQKIDQLFILNPIVIVNQNIENEADKVNKVNQVGELTKTAFNKMQLGGFIISENNMDDVTGRILEFAASLKELANDTYDMPLFLGVDQRDKSLFEVEENNGLTPDFVINKTVVNNLNETDLQIKCFVEKPDIQEIVSALSENFDMLIVFDKEFDYFSVRAEVARRLSEEKINEKVSNVIKEKLKSKSISQESDETGYEDVMNENFQTIGQVQNADMWKSNYDKEIVIEEETDAIQVQINSEAVTND